MLTATAPAPLTDLPDPPKLKPRAADAPTDTALILFRLTIAVGDAVDPAGTGSNRMV